MAVDKEVEEYLEASGNPLLDDYMDPINNQYGVFNPTQEPGFINRYFYFYQRAEMSCLCVCSKRVWK